MDIPDSGTGTALRLDPAEPDLAEPEVAELEAALLERLRGLPGRPGLVVAFSGGVDSTVVLAGAVRALGADATVAAIADSASLARAELDGARSVAAEIGAELVTLRTEELADPGYRANAGNRCYFCKQTVLGAARELARRRGYRHVATGTHLDDRRAPHRPGLRAAAELGVHEPLADIGAGKAAVRALATHWGLTVRDKPSMPCLASRIAVGVPVSVARLGVVERAELAARGHLAEHRVPVRDLRVRLLGDDGFRVELDPEALRMLDAPGGAGGRSGLLARVAEAGADGHGDVTCYQSGSLSG